MNALDLIMVMSCNETIWLVWEQPIDLAMLEAWLRRACHICVCGRGAGEAGDSSDGMRQILDQILLCSIPKSTVIRHVLGDGH